MATIEIVGWRKNHVGWTGFDAYARTELKKRLRSGINASPKEMRDLFHQILERQTVVLANVHEKATERVRQILETMGAEVRVSPEKR